MTINASLRNLSNIYFSSDLNKARRRSQETDFHREPNRTKLQSEKGLSVELPHYLLGSSPWVLLGLLMREYRRTDDAGKAIGDPYHDCSPDWQIISGQVSRRQ